MIKMNFKKIAIMFVGIVAMLLGLLWFLQGLDLVQIKPILCFANCEPITGGSLLWTIIGLIVFFIGIGAIYLGLRDKKSNTN